MRHIGTFPIFLVSGLEAEVTDGENHGELISYVGLLHLPITTDMIRGGCMVPGYLHTGSFRKVTELVLWSGGDVG